MAFAALTDVLPGLRRRPADPPRPSLPPYVPADEPAHSPACYCAVENVLDLPCGNCVREGFAPAPGRVGAHFSPGYRGEVPDHLGAAEDCPMPACADSRARGGAS